MLLQKNERTYSKEKSFMKIFDPDFCDSSERKVDDISVIIPVYNAEKFVRKSVESALQFDEVKEVILVEDGSPITRFLYVLFM